MTDAPSILAISSTVAVGHVGLSAIVPTLNLVGQPCAALPTTVLANHPGFAQTAGTRVDTDTLAMTMMPTPHVRRAACEIRRTRPRIMRARLSQKIHA